MKQVIVFSFLLVFLKKLEALGKVAEGEYTCGEGLWV